MSRDRTNACIACRCEISPRLKRIADNLTMQQRKALELLIETGVFAHWRAVRSLVDFGLAENTLPPRLTPDGERVAKYLEL